MYTFLELYGNSENLTSITANYGVAAETREKVQQLITELLIVKTDSSQYNNSVRDFSSKQVQ